MKKEQIKKKESKVIDNSSIFANKGDKDPYTIIILELVQQLEDKEKVKVLIENQYYQTLGQIQLLKDQIKSLSKREKVKNK